jgi:membrane fusion protein, multidrug efflux system
VREEDPIKRGQVLARISPLSYRDAVSMARIQVDRAEDAYRRLEPMSRNRTLPEIKMVEVESGRQQAKLALSMAEKNLGDTVLRAYSDGVISKVWVDPGAAVAPGVPVVTVVQTSSMLATTAIPEMQLGQVKTGGAAAIEVPALGVTLDGVIREISIIANPLTRTYEAKITLPNPGADLRVGMVAEVRVRVPGDGPAIVVPPAAVRVDEAGAPCVFVVQGDRLARRAVKVAGFVGEGTVIASGVLDGELLVTSGTPMLADGMTVRVVAAARP